MYRFRATPPTLTVGSTPVVNGTPGDLLTVGSDGLLSQIVGSGAYLPLTGGTLTIGATSELGIDGPDSVHYSFSFPINAIDHRTELVLSCSNPFLTTLVLKNTATAGYSACSLHDSTGREKGTFGWGNSAAAAQYQNTLFIEAFNGYDFGGSGVAPPRLVFTRTGWNVNFTGTSAGSNVSGTTMTIVGVPTITVQANQVVSGAGVTGGTKVVAQLTGTIGGVGTYSLDTSSAATGAITITLTGADTLENAYAMNTDWSQQWSQGNAHGTPAMTLYASGGLYIGPAPIDPGTSNFRAAAAGTFGGTLTAQNTLVLSAGNFNMHAAAIPNFTGRGGFKSLADGVFAWVTTAGTVGASYDIATADTIKFRNLANNADAAVTALSLSLNSATLLATRTALTNGAGASGGTLLNAPAAGNPTKWVPIDDNGTTRYIPCW